MKATNDAAATKGTVVVARLLQATNLATDAHERLKTEAAAMDDKVRNNVSVVSVVIITIMI